MCTYSAYVYLGARCCLGVCITSDFISGFCGETEAAHQDSLSLIRRVQYEFCYCFPYSMREVCIWLVVDGELNFICLKCVGIQLGIHVEMTHKCGSVC